MNEDNCWDVSFQGPETSPFEGKKYTVKLVLEGFPYSPPKVYFKTPIYHPNIDVNDGRVCEGMVVDQSKWDPTSRIAIVLEKLKELMLVPSPTSGSNDAAFNDLQKGTWYDKAKIHSQKAM